MKYFLLEQHKDYNRGPTIKEWYGRIDLNHLRNIFDQEEEDQIFDITTDQYTIFPDILTFPCLLVSEEMKKVISLYERQLPFRDFYFMEKEKNIGLIYSLPILPVVDCLTDDSIFSGDKSKVERGIVDVGIIGERHLVEAAGTSGQSVIISLDLAESLLRKGLTGIGLREVEIVS